MKDYELLRQIKAGDKLLFRHRDSCYVLRSEDCQIEQQIPHWTAESLRDKRKIEIGVSGVYYTSYRLRSQGCE